MSANRTNQQKCVKSDLFCELLFMGCIDCNNKPVCHDSLFNIYCKNLAKRSQAQICCLHVCVHACTSHRQQERKDSEHVSISSGRRIWHRGWIYTDRRVAQLKTRRPRNMLMVRLFFQNSEAFVFVLWPDWNKSSGTLTSTCPENQEEQKHVLHWCSHRAASSLGKMHKLQQTPLMTSPASGGLINQ